MPLLLHGASNPDSIGIYLDWLQHFAAQLAQGDLYPRWLMDMNRGAGSPAFYYYAPLAFYIASIPALALAGYKASIQLAWADWLLLALSGLSFYVYARRRFGMATALSGSLIYMVLPYHFEIDLWDRQDLGELANYIWLPLVLGYTERLFEDRRVVVGLAASYSLTLVSHLPTALLFSICLCGYVLVHAVERRSLAGPALFGGGIVLGIMLAGIYWVPALFCQHYVRINALWDSAPDFHTWFFPVRGIEWFRNDMEGRNFALRVFTVVSLTTVIFAMCWIAALRRNGRLHARELVGCLVLMAVAWFLMLPASVLIWEYAPVLWKVQFPWRISMVVDLTAAIAAMYPIHALCRERDATSAAVIVISLAILSWCLATANFTTKIESFYSPAWLADRAKQMQDGVDVAEYTTAWNLSKAHFDTSLHIAGRPQLSYEGGNGTVSVAHWRPRDIELSVMLLRPVRVNVRQFYFPNWRARVNGGAALPVSPSSESGLIDLDLPAGRYHASLHLDPMREELFGACLTLGATILLLIWSTWDIRLARVTAVRH